METLASLVSWRCILGSAFCLNLWRVDLTCAVERRIFLARKVYAMLFSVMIRNNSKDAFLQFLKMMMVEISNISIVRNSGANRSYGGVCRQRQEVQVCGWERGFRGEGQNCGVGEWFLEMLACSGMNE